MEGLGAGRFAAAVLAHIPFWWIYRGYIGLYRDHIGILNGVYRVSQKLGWILILAYRSRTASPTSVWTEECAVLTRRSCKSCLCFNTF